MDSKRIQSTQLSRHLRHSCSRRSFPTLTARPMKTSSPWATWVRWQGQWRSLSFPARRRRNEPYILTRNKNSKFNKIRFLFFYCKNFRFSLWIWIRHPHWLTAIHAERFPLQLKKYFNYEMRARSEMMKKKEGKLLQLHEMWFCVVWNAAV